MDGQYGVSVVILLLFLLSLKGNLAENFYCSNNQDVPIQKVTKGTIYTRNNGSSHYGNNMQCKWTISAGNEQSAIQVKVKRSQLQWAPAGAICVGYDYVRIYDGDSSNDREIVNWCGEMTPLSFTSSGSQLHIIFISNDRNQRPFTGVELEFQTFVKSPTLGSCPSGWRDNSALGDGGSTCYRLMLHPVTWTVAQAHCTYDQANLASIKTQEEDKFIAEWVVNASEVRSYDKVWISLNDIEEDGEYVWIDRSEPTFYSWQSEDHKAEAYYNCIALNKQGKWVEDFCNENDIQSTVKHKFFCQKSKVGTNEIFDLPTERTDRGGEKTPTSRRTWVILGSLVAVVVAIVVMIVLFVCCCRKNKDARRFTLCRRDSPDAAVPMREDARLPPTASNNAQSTPTAPPPTPPTNQPTTIVMVVPAASNEPPPAYDDIDHSAPLDPRTT